LEHNIVDNQGASTTSIIWNFTTEGQSDWEVLLNFTETSGKYDYIYFGEKEAASNQLDIYDVPKKSSRDSTKYPFLV